MIFSRIKAAFFSFTFILSVFWVVFFMWAFNEHNRPIRRVWGRFQRLCGGYTLKVEGEFNDEANMIIMNHQSMLDIIVLEEVHPQNICWLAKKEIKKIPIIGKIIDIPKMIAVDRESKHALVKIIKEAEDRVQNGRVLAVFPEGTRSRTNKLLPFKGGAKIIADKLNLKIQPIVLVGTDILDVTTFSFKNGEVKIICLDLIDTSDKNWLENAREKMQEVYDAELALRQNAKS